MNASLPVPATIAFVSNNCWSLFHFRGSLMRHFLDRGFRVVAIAEPDEFAGYVRDMGCVYHPVSIRNSAVSPWHDIRLMARLRRIYEKESPAVIFHYVTKPCIYGSFVAGRKNIPSISVITGLGYVYTGRRWISKPVNFLFRAALRHASEVWFLNLENASFFIRKKLVGPEKTRVLPGEGIDTGFYTPVPLPDHPRPFVFIMVSRLLWSKGIGTFMDAARMVREKEPGTEFRFAGRPEAGHPEAIPGQYLQEWVDRGLLVNLGYSRDVRTVLSAADCFVLPTYYEEGIPMTLMEACSMALPVITTDQAGCNTVVEDGFNGLLCRPRDAADLAEKMLSMIRLKKEDRDKMGRNGRDRMVSRFDISLVVRQYDEALARLRGI